MAYVGLFNAALFSCQILETTCMSVGKTVGVALPQTGKKYSYICMVTSLVYY